MYEKAARTGNLLYRATTLGGTALTLILFLWKGPMGTFRLVQMCIRDSRQGQSQDSEEVHPALHRRALRHQDHHRNVCVRCDQGRPGHDRNQPLSLIHICNAWALCGSLTPKEENIIISHMWPLARKMPRYRESFVVNLADKTCATLEVVGLYRYLRRRRRRKAAAA